ncbi:MAG: hypothetical protein ACE366_07435 [Bradymonadia bacterium]
MKRALTEVLRRSGVKGKPLKADCAEYPCLISTTIRVPSMAQHGQDSTDVVLKRTLKDMFRGQNARTFFRIKFKRSGKKKRLYFNIHFSAWPKDDYTPDDNKKLKQRLRFRRRQQFRNKGQKKR